VRAVVSAHSILMGRSSATCWGGFFAVS